MFNTKLTDRVERSEFKKLENLVTSLQRQIQRLEVTVAKPRLDSLLEELYKYDGYTPGDVPLKVGTDKVGFYKCGYLIDNYLTETEFIRNVLNPAKVRWAEKQRCAETTPPPVFFSTATGGLINTESTITDKRKRRGQRK